MSPPAIPLAGSWADAYQQQHGPLIDLSQAVPNYPPHPKLLETLSVNASDVELCPYGAIEGESSLRENYSQLVNRQYQSTTSDANVHITSGCNQAFFATLLTVAKPGSSVLMTNPCYFNQKATAEVLGYGVKFVNADAEQGFLPALADLEQAIDSSISVLALVSPNNPTGAIYSGELLQQIFELCQRRDVWLVVDETYRDFAESDGEPMHRLFENTDWERHFVQLYSFSKTFSVPGHRIGAVTAGADVIAGITKVMDNMQICAPRPAQLALAEMIGHLSDWILENNAMIARRADAFKQVIVGAEGWSIKSLGAYFAYVEHPYNQLDSATLVQRMASEYGVLPLPGAFFGDDQDRHLRMAFANADVDYIHMMPERLADIDRALR